MTVRALYEALRAILGELDAPAFEAQCILSHCGLSRAQLIGSPQAQAGDAAAERAAALAKRRAQGYPLQYLLGEWEFYSLPFYVGEGVLIPRADTEALVDVALEALQALQARKRLLIADLCSGSGCVAIALAKHLPGAEVYAIELDTQAARYLRQNVGRHGVPVRIAEADALDEQTACALPMLDAVVSNPPYLSQRDMDTRMVEVCFEPERALFGGADGLDFYRAMIPLWAKKLRSGGLMALEVGAGQDEAVAGMLTQSGLRGIKTKTDIGGIRRVVYGYQQ